VKRAIQVKMGDPALTDYVFLQNRSMGFSKTSAVHGKVLSNGCIEFNGTTDAEIESARIECRQRIKRKFKKEPGVWGTGGPKQFWKFPVPAQDFNAVSTNLATIKKMSDNGGIHLYPSGKQGWHLIFKSDGTFDVYKVTKVQSRNHPYDIARESFFGHYTIPSNGAIFVEDTTWVQGTVHGLVTVGVGSFPVQYPFYNIYINGNILYSQKNSTDVLGLLAQGDIEVTKAVPTNLEIDAALLSQFGGIGLPDQGISGNSLEVFGSQISQLSTGWKYIDWHGNVLSGFVNTNYTYDSNLKFNPPPGFPVQGTYELISWAEVTP